MALMDFSLPASDPNNPNGVTSASDLQRRQLLAQALMKQGSDSSPIQSPWQGAARMAQALMGGWQEGSLEHDQAAGTKAANDQLASLIAGYGGASSAPPAGGSVTATPAASADNSSSSSLPAFASMQGNQPSAAIGGTLSAAAQKYGEDPNTLTQIAGIESHFDPNAKNPNSSASGLLQFTKGTAAQYGVTNPFDVNQAADGGAALLHDNHIALANALGRDPTPGELYLAHQQGAGGAIKLLTNPDAPASSLVGNAAVALNGGNPNMTAGQFSKLWTNRLDGNSAPAVAPASAALANAVSPPAGAQPGTPVDANSYVGANGQPTPYSYGSAGQQAPVQVASNNPNFVPSQAAVMPPPPQAAAPQAPAPQAAAPAGPSISVPGYDGTFSRAQANDGDGVPSQAEWDAAAKSAQGSPAASPAPVQVAAAAPAPSAPAAAAAPAQNQAQIKAALSILQSPYASPAQQQIAQTILTNAIKQDAYSQPYKDQFGNVVQRAQNGEIKILNAAPASTDSKTSDIKNFEYAKSNGYTGDFTTFETQQKAQQAGNHVIGTGGALVGPDGKVLYQNTPKSGFDDDTANNLADRVLAGESGVLTGLGRGAQGAENIAKVQGIVAQKMAAQNMPADAIAKAKTEIAGKMQEQRTLGSATASNTLYGDTAAAAMDTALKASAAVPRSNWKPLNVVANMGMNAYSDPAYGAFLAANNTLVNEYAKATTPVGSPTDSQRAHAFEMLNTADGPEKYDTVVRMMHKEIENTHSAIGLAHQQLKSGDGAIPPLQTPPPGAPAAAAVGSGDPLSQARAAIAAGAPRDAVIQRLQQHGINPAGL